MSFEVHPLTPGRWDDLAELFSNPIVNWCWCQHYRRSGKAVFGMQDGELVRPSSKEKLKSLVDRDYVHGLIGYEDGRLVGWMSLGPREDYFRLERSPIAKPVDDKPVWSIVCFYVEPRSRGKGYVHALLEAGVEYARSCGATLLEAYPVDKEGEVHSSEWSGSKSVFDRAGFKEVARRKKTRPVMRLAIQPHEYVPRR